MTGRIVRLHPAGYGFLRTQHVASDVFFSSTVVDRGFGYVFNDLRPGMTVQFSLVYMNEKPQARHVRLITDL
jgi:cold shock CspA family protein